MKTAWTKGIRDKQVKEDIQASYRASAMLRERLIAMLISKSKERERASMGAEGYDCPNWAYKQADAQGYKRALSEIISLISEK